MSKALKDQKPSKKVIDMANNQQRINFNNMDFNLENSELFDIDNN